MEGESGAMFDYPQWGISAAQQSSLLHTAAVLACLSFLCAAWLCWRWKAIFPLCIFLGAGLAVFYEPLGDILTGVAYAPVGQVSSLHSFGRPTPLWMVPNYFFFFCAPVLGLLQFVVKPGISATRWWLVYAGLTVLVMLFEQPGISAGVWRYYLPNQAFSIHTYPIWVAFDNAQTIFSLAAGIYLLRSRLLHGIAELALIPLLPVLLTGVHVGASLFIGSALYATRDLLIVNLAAIATIAICLLIVGIEYWLVATSPNRARIA